VLIEAEPFEITTFRIDENYLDNRRPEKVLFTRSLEKDLERRDFTVNAMAYSEKTGLVDIFGGASDLEHGIIRTVGDADARFIGGQNAQCRLHALPISTYILSIINFSLKLSLTILYIKSFQKSIF
jgi:hypothetical protein